MARAESCLPNKGELESSKVTIQFLVEGGKEVQGGRYLSINWLLELGIVVCGLFLNIQIPLMKRT